MEYISLKSALNDYFIGTGKKDEVNEDALLQWAADCLNKIGNFRQYNYNVAVLDISNYKAKLPKDFIAVESMHYKFNTSCTNLSLELSEVIIPALEEQCNITVTRTCDGCCGNPIIETDASQYLNQNFPWHGYSRVVATSNIYQQRYKDQLIPMKLSDKAAMKLHLPDCININNTSDILYTIRDNNIVSNQKTGSIVLFYLGQVTDEEGYPMIPNKVEYIEAIFYYLNMKDAWVDYSGDKTQQSRLFFTDAKNLSDNAIARCVSIMNTPTWEEAKEIATMWRQRIPQLNLNGNNLDYNVERFKFVNNAGYKSTFSNYRYK